MSARPEGVAVWITGLPASGKTTLANALVTHLRAQGEVVLPLDSDALRRHMAIDAYDETTRMRLYGLLAYLAYLGSEAGAIVIVSATAHRRAWRDAARARLARFVEVWLDVDKATCAARDPKGLWRAAAAGRIMALPGAGVEYEAPLAPEVRLAAEVPTAEAVTAVELAIARARAMVVSDAGRTT